MGIDILLSVVSYIPTYTITTAGLYKLVIHHSLIVCFYNGWSVTQSVSQLVNQAIDISQSFGLSVRRSTFVVNASSRLITVGQLASILSHVSVSQLVIQSISKSVTPSISQSVSHESFS